MVKDSKDGGFKKRDLILLLIVVGIVTGIVYYLNRTPSVRVVEKASPWSNVGRYENSEVGFSVEYDADLLTKEFPQTRPGFVYTRATEQEQASMGVFVGFYPEGKTFESIVPSTMRSIKSTNPGSKINGRYNEEHIELADGTEAFYYEIKWHDGKTDLRTVFVLTEENDKMITVFGQDREEGFREDLKTMVQTLTFDVEVDEATVKARGFAENGRLARTDSPAFTIEYPKAFKNRPLGPGQIFNSGIPQGAPSIAISISPLKPDLAIGPQLSGFAPWYAKALEGFGSDIKTISNQPINNYKTFPAYQFELRWKFQARFDLTTVAHIIAKENQTIFLVGHTTVDKGELLDIFKTINLNP